jgi:cysteinyl-tRNA synthetase
MAPATSVGLTGVLASGGVGTSTPTVTDAPDLSSPSRKNGLFGLTPEEESWILGRIEARKQARKARDFKAADAIRDELLGKGIILEDTPQGVRWKRKS